MNIDRKLVKVWSSDGHVLEIEKVKKVRSKYGSGDVNLEFLAKYDDVHGEPVYRRLWMRGVEISDGAELFCNPSTCTDQVLDGLKHNLNVCPVGEEEFRRICLDHGMVLYEEEIGGGYGRTIDAYIPCGGVLRGTRNVNGESCGGQAYICHWDDGTFGRSMCSVGYFDALWKESDGRYCVNGSDLGDCECYCGRKERLVEVLDRLVEAMGKLRGDPGYRPVKILL